MKIKTQEIVFVIICLCAAVVAIAAVAIVRDGSADNELTIDYGEFSTEDEQYDISVINFATLEDFMQVSGIGEVKAGDIIAYRNAIGGFTRVNQLKDVNGISDALYQRIIEYFYLRQTGSQVTTAPEDISKKTTPSAKDTAPLTTTGEPSASPETTTKRPQSSASVSESEKIMHKVDINSASAKEIADALMIDAELAEEIVELRSVIIHFSTVQELMLCDGMTTEIYRRIKEYVVIG